LKPIPNPIGDQESMGEIIGAFVGHRFSKVLPYHQKAPLSISAGQSLFILLHSLDAPLYPQIRGSQISLQFAVAWTGTSVLKGLRSASAGLRVPARRRGRFLSGEVGLRLEVSAWHY